MNTPSNTAYLTREAIDPEAWRRQQADGASGASVEFLGVVRATESEQPIAALEYEAYEPMAERLMARCVGEAKARWSLRRICVRHRLGRIAVGEIAVLIGVQAPHRAEAFAACQFLIDAIKRDVPIWKRAICADGAALETACTHGDQPH